MAEKKFSKKEEYILSGKTFNVIVTHWHTDGYTDIGLPPEEHWCLYVVLGKTHPLYEKACDNKNDYDLDLGNEVYSNWHGGCTYYDKQNDYVKIGCDYQHAWDTHYWSCTEMPEDIKNDAMDLYNFFEAQEKQNLIEDK